MGRARHASDQNVNYLGDGCWPSVLAQRREVINALSKRHRVCFPETATGQQQQVLQSIAIRSSGHHAVITLSGNDLLVRVPLAVISLWPRTCAQGALAARVLLLPTFALFRTSGGISVR